MTMNSKAAKVGRVPAARTKAKRAAPAEPPRKKDVVALKEQKAAATREAVAVIQACSGLSAIEIEERLGIGRQKQSKRAGRSGEMINSYLNADIERDTAANATLARLMFSAVEHGLVNPHEFISMSARPGIRRAILPVRSLLLQLAIRGESNATKEEADRGYREWCKALGKKTTACTNERAQFIEWKKKACKGLVEFVDRLASMKQHAWSLTLPNMVAAVEVDGYLSVDSGEAFFQRVDELRAMIEAIQLDPLHEIDGDLPDVKDSSEEGAEVQRQLSQHLDRPTVAPEEWDGYVAAIKAEQVEIDAKIPVAINKRSGDLSVYRREISRLDDVTLEPAKKPEPGVLTVAQVLEWQARQEATPEAPTVLIKP